MAFKGDLRNVHLADILQTLAQNQQEGVLTLTSDSHRRRILFTDAGISLLDSSATGRRRLGEILRRSNLVSEEQLNEALREHSRSNCFLGEVLVERGIIEEEQLQRILQIQVEEELYDLFRIMEGGFEFHEEELDDYEPQVAPLHVDGVVLEAARRLDEWQIIAQSIPDLTRVYILQQPNDEHRLDEEETVVAECLDGKHTVQNAADALLSSPFSVAKVLARLLDRGEIRETTPTERLAAAEASLELGQPMQAVSLLQGLRHENPGEDLLRAIAPLLTEAGAPEKGAEVRIQLAESARRRNDPEEAWHQLKTARQDCPDSADVLGQLAVIAQDQGEEEVEARLRRRIAELQADGGDVEGAANSLERVHSLHPSDREVRRRLVDASLRARRKSRAIELLLAESEELRGADQVTDLVRVYKRILTIDSRRTDIKKMLRKVRLSRAERTIRVAGWAAAILITLAVGAYGVSSWMDTQEAESQLAEATALFHDGQHDAARTMVQGVLQQFTQREVVLTASSLLDRIDSALHKRTRQERSTLEDVFDEQLHAIESQVADGRFDLALSALFRIVDTHHEAYLRDRAEIRLKQTCRRLKAHVADSIRLAAEYAAPTRDPDVHDAYVRMSLSFPAEGITRIEQIRSSLQVGHEKQKQPQRWLQDALDAMDSWRQAFERMQPEIIALRDHHEHLQALERLSDDYVEAEEALAAGEPEKATALYRQLLTKYGDGELRPVLEEKIRQLEAAISTCEEIERLLNAGKVDVAEALAKVARKDFIAMEMQEVLELPVRVDSFPSGARVLIDGTIVGTCPMVVRVRAAQTREVEVEAEGFERTLVTLNPQEMVLALTTLSKLTRCVVELGGAVEAPAIWHQGAVWVSMRAGNLRRIEVPSGATLEFPTESLSGSRFAPLSTPHGVLHATVDGRLWMIDVEDGRLRERWSADFGSELLCTPILWGELLFVANPFGELRALGVEDGKRRWLIPLEKQRIVAAPALAGDLLYVPLDGGTIAAFDLQKRERPFECAVDGEVFGALRADQERLVAITTAGRVLVFDPRTGDRRLGVNLGQSPIAAPTLHGNSLDVVLGASVVRVELSQGRVSERWLLSQTATAVTVVGDALWIGDQKGKLHGFVPGKPEAIFISAVGDRALVGAPSVQDDLIAVLCADGRLRVVDR